MNATQTKTHESDGALDAVTVIARCRWNLTLEARGLATRMIADGAFNAQTLRDQVVRAIANARPSSRLIPWHLTDRVVERIVDAVVADVSEKWTLTPNRLTRF